MLRARLVFLTLLVAQIANEASNSLGAAVLPWAVFQETPDVAGVLFGLAGLCAFSAGLSLALRQLSAKQDLLRLWWPACVVSALTIFVLLLLPGANVLSIGAAAIILLCAEPLIELGTSVKMPEQAARLGIAQSRLNAWLLLCGSLSMATAPLLAPVLARQLARAQLLDLVLALALLGIACLAPLRSSAALPTISPHEGAAPLVDAADIGDNRQRKLRQVLRYAPSVLCLMLGFEAALLPWLSRNRADALSLQSNFVLALALGVAAGALLRLVLPVSNRLIKAHLSSPKSQAYQPNARALLLFKVLLAAFAIGALTSSALTELAQIKLLLGGALSGLILGLEVPEIEALLQSAATPQARILALLSFSTTLLWRCALGFAVLALLMQFLTE
jgi:hypothetical protein